MSDNLPNHGGNRQGGADKAYPQPKGGLLDRVPPHSIEAEEGLLAACIIDGGQEVMTFSIESKLEPDAFYKPKHQVLFQALRDLYEAGNGIDEIIVCDYLRSHPLSNIKGRERDPQASKSQLDYLGGVAFITGLIDRIETTVHARYWLEIVREKWMLRRMINTARHVVEECYTQQDKIDSFIETVEQQIFSISQDRVSDSAAHISKSVDEASLMIQKLLQGESSEGVLSGFIDLDKMTFGLHAQEMIVLAARPSMGKTSLAMNIAEHAALPDGDRPGNATLVFSLEMGADQLAMRLLCGRARVNLKRVRDRLLSRDEQQRLIDAAKELKKAPIWIEDMGHLTILELRAKARRIHAKHGLKLIVIDYLQLLNGTDSRVPREQQISEISRGIKAMAKELYVPVIVLSQLNRDSEKEKRRPRLSDLRESGSIEQDADVVLLLSKGQESQNDDSSVPIASTSRELIVAKNRNGPVGALPLTFRAEFTRFENYTSNIEEPNEL